MLCAFFLFHLLYIALQACLLSCMTIERCSESSLQSKHAACGIWSCKIPAFRRQLAIPFHLRGLPSAEQSEAFPATVAAALFLHGLLRLYGLFTDRRNLCLLTGLTNSKGLSTRFVTNGHPAMHILSTSQSAGLSCELVLGVSRAKILLGLSLP